MREIKFRAWTGLKMEYNIMAGFLGAFWVAGIDPNDSASMSNANTLYWDQTPIMQYTGLKDKNGKEIYEGDIVDHAPHMRDSDYVKSKPKNPYLDVVEYDQDSLMWDGIGRYEEAWFNKSQLEVIGNIYENPELIK